MSFNLLRLSLGHLNALSDTGSSILVLLEHWVDNRESTSSLSIGEVTCEDLDKSKEEQTVLVELKRSKVAIHVEVWYLGLLVKSKNVKDISNNVHDSRDKEDVPEDSQALGFGLHCVLLLSQD